MAFLTSSNGTISKLQMILKDKFPLTFAKGGMIIDY